MQIKKYTRQHKMLLAVDCIIFGFDGTHLKLLLIKRGFEPQKGRWSLMGGFVQPDETLDHAASRILKHLTGLSDIYLEQLFAFSNPYRDPTERTVSVAYFALVDINEYKQQISNEYNAEWFSFKKLPSVIFDHKEMIEMAKERLRYKAAFNPVLFELLPEKFTLPQLQTLYEDVYNTVFDKGNFSRKMLSSGLLIKQKDKEKNGSKKGAFYYKLDKRKYQFKLNSLLNLVPNPKQLNQYAMKHIAFKRN